METNADRDRDRDRETDSNTNTTVRSWPVAGAVFAVLWLLVRGVALTPRAIVGQFLLGLAVGLPVAYVFRRLYDERVDLGRIASSLPAAGLYLATFAWELVRANFDVAYRVLAPNMPIEPEVILIPLRVESDLAITTIANSITVTPGTITLDHADDVNALYVHVVDGRDPDAIVRPIRRWEDYALEMFDEERSPDDPAAAFVVSGGDRWGEKSDVGPETQSGLETETETDTEIETDTDIDTGPETDTETETDTNIDTETRGDSDDGE